MRILFMLLVLGGLLLPAAPALAFGVGNGGGARCERRARSLEVLETAHERFEQLPGFLAELLARWFARVAQGAAWR